MFLLVNLYVVQRDVTPLKACKVVMAAFEMLIHEASSKTLWIFCFELVVQRHVSNWPGHVISVNRLHCVITVSKRLKNCMVLQWGEICVILCA